MRHRPVLPRACPVKDAHCLSSGLALRLAIIELMFYNIHGGLTMEDQECFVLALSDAFLEDTGNGAVESKKSRN
jgi:hypothetical protein